MLGYEELGEEDAVETTVIGAWGPVEGWATGPDRGRHPVRVAARPQSRDRGDPLGDVEGHPVRCLWRAYRKTSRASSAFGRSSALRVYPHPILEQDVATRSFGLTGRAGRGRPPPRLGTQASARRNRRADANRSGCSTWGR